MKKQVSVFGLHTRAALNRLLLAALGLLAVELILAGVCIARGTALTLSGSSLENCAAAFVPGRDYRASGAAGIQPRFKQPVQLYAAAAAGIGALRIPLELRLQYALLCGLVVCADHGSCGRGILERKKRRVFGWPAGRVCGFLPQRLSAWASAAGRRVCRGRATQLFVLALGCVTAAYAAGMRKKGSRAGWSHGADVLLVLNLSVQYTAGRSTGIFHAITALLVGLGFLGFGLTQTHNGKDGLADEVE